MYSRNIRSKSYVFMIIPWKLQCLYMWVGLGKGTLWRKNWNWDIGSGSKSSEKLFLSPIFVFCRISLSDPYSTSLPNFKCQNNLKEPKRAVERQATFYSLSFSIYNKRGMGGDSKKQLKKTGIALRLLHALYSLPLAENLPLQRIE